MREFFGETTLRYDQRRMVMRGGVKPPLLVRPRRDPTAKRSTLSAVKSVKELYIFAENAVKNGFSLISESVIPEGRPEGLVKGALEGYALPGSALTPHSLISNGVINFERGSDS